MDYGTNCISFNILQTLNHSFVQNNGYRRYKTVQYLKNTTEFDFGMKHYRQHTLSWVLLKHWALVNYIFYTRILKLWQFKPYILHPKIIKKGVLFLMLRLESQPNRWVTLLNTEIQPLHIALWVEQSWHITNSCCLHFE